MKKILFAIFLLAITIIISGCSLHEINKLYKYYAESGNAPNFYLIYNEDYDAYRTSLQDGEYLWIGTDATERN